MCNDTRWNRRDLLNTLIFASFCYYSLFSFGLLPFPIVRAYAYLQARGTIDAPSMTSFFQLRTIPLDINCPGLMIFYGFN